VRLPEPEQQDYEAKERHNNALGFEGEAHESPVAAKPVTSAIMSVVLLERS
jgi:hypothetical protein